MLFNRVQLLLFIENACSPAALGPVLFTSEDSMEPVDPTCVIE